MSISNNANASEKDRRQYRRRYTKRERGPLRRMVRLQLRRTARVLIHARRAIVAARTFEHAIVHDRCHGQAKRGAELGESLKQTARDRLFAWAGDAGNKQCTGGKNEIGAENGADSGGKAKCPVGCAGVDECEEKAC